LGIAFFILILAIYRDTRICQEEAAYLKTLDNEDNKIRDILQKAEYINRNC
jgi:hypothetical protein